MIVDAEIWRWSPSRMVRSTDTIDGYVLVRDMERLLEEAHARGKRQGERMAEEATRQRRL